MNRIIIVGGGFAGTSALRSLAGASNTEVTLIDRKAAFEFLPMLPEVVGKRMPPQIVSVPLDGYARRYGATFRRARCTRVNLDDRTVSLADGASVDYDYLVVGTGAVTNFYGNDDAAANALRLRRLDHAREILSGLDSGGVKRMVVVGGGYTGIEVATQLRRYARKSATPLEITVVELMETVLPMRPEWMQQYVAAQLSELDIEVKTETSVESVSGTVTLTTGEEVPDSLVVWNAGVTVDAPVADVDADKKGRIIVDDALKLSDRCYVVGDAAHYVPDGSQAPLFMASYFAVQQGAAAARNILREADGAQPKPYNPTDYGFVIPLANGKGCGKLFGVNVRGRLPVLVHHGAGFKRARSTLNRWTRMKAVLREGMGL